MTIYPAIDLVNGQVVRLSQGDYGRQTTYSDEPAKIARQFAAEGAEYIHIVDLDGAKAKQPVNLAAIQAIAEAVDVPLQVGGGIRSIDAAQQILNYVDRVIIGTIALTDLGALQAIVTKFGPTKVVVSVDYKNGLPAANGWLETTDLDTPAIQARLKKASVTTVIVTDVSKDGLLQGPNIELMKEWKVADFEVICAGGVTTVEDIKQLKMAGIEGVIIGKALYEDRITLKEVLDAAR